MFFSTTSWNLSVSSLFQETDPWFIVPWRLAVERFLNFITNITSIYRRFACRIPIALWWAQDYICSTKTTSVWTKINLGKIGRALSPLSPLPLPPPSSLTARTWRALCGLNTSLNGPTTSRVCAVHYTQTGAEPGRTRSSRVWRGLTLITCHFTVKYCESRCKYLLDAASYGSGKSLW